MVFLLEKWCRASASGVVLKLDLRGLGLGRLNMRNWEVGERGEGW